MDNIFDYGEDDATIWLVDGIAEGEESCAEWIARVDAEFCREMLIKVPAHDDAEYLRSLGVKPL